MNNNDEYKWIKARVNLKDLKKLKKLAVDDDTSLVGLFKKIITKFLYERR